MNNQIAKEDFTYELINYADDKLKWVKENIYPKKNLSEKEKLDTISKLDDLKFEIINWCYEKLPSFHKPYIVGVFTLSFIEHLYRNTNIGSYYGYLDWHDDENLRRDFIEKLLDLKLIEDARLLSIYSVLFWPKFDNIKIKDFTNIQGQKSARCLTDIIDNLRDKTPPKIFESVVLTTSYAVLDDEALDVCIWTLDVISEDKITLDKKIIKELIISAWYNAAAGSEYFDFYDFKNKTLFEKNNIFKIANTNLYNLMCHHIEFLGKEDFFEFITKEITEYSSLAKDMDNYQVDLCTKILCGLVAFSLIYEDKPMFKKLLKNYDNYIDDKITKNKNIHFNSNFLEFFYLFYFIKNTQQIEKLLVKIFDNYDLIKNNENLFKLPNYNFGNNVKNRANLLLSISKQPKFKLKIDQIKNNLLDTRILALKNQPEKVLENCIKYNFGIDVFDHLSKNWKKDKKFLEILYKSFPKEIIEGIKKYDVNTLLKLILEIRYSKRFLYTEEGLILLKIIYDVDTNNPLKILTKFCNATRYKILQNLNPRADPENKFFKIILQNPLTKKYRKYRDLILYFAKKDYISHQNFNYLINSKRVSDNDINQIIEYMLPYSYYNDFYLDIMKLNKFDIIENLISEKHKKRKIFTENFLNYIIDNSNKIKSNNIDINKLKKIINQIDGQISKDVSYRLAVLYTHGIVVNKDPTKRIHLLEISSKLGSGVASRGLALASETTDDEKKIKYFKLSIKQGDLSSHYHLGVKYLLTKENDKAIKSFETYLNLANIHKIDYEVNHGLNARKFLSELCFDKENPEKSWRIILKIIGYQTEKFIEDGNYIYDKLWITEYFLSIFEILNRENIEDALKALSQFLRNLCNEENKNFDAKKVCILIDHFFKLVSEYGVEYNFDNLILYSDQMKLISKNDLKDDFNFKYFENLKFTNQIITKPSENDKAILYNIVFWSFDCFAKFNINIDDAKLRKLLKLFPFLNQDHDMCFQLSRAYGNNDELKCHQYLKKAVELKNNDETYNNNLGIQYYEGIGCPKNTILALAHLSIAKTLGSETAKRNYQFVYEEATIEQRAKAEEKANEIWEKIVD